MFAPRRRGRGPEYQRRGFFNSSVRKEANFKPYGSGNGLLSSKMKFSAKSLFVPGPAVSVGPGGEP